LAGFQVIIIGRFWVIPEAAIPASLGSSQSIGCWAMVAIEGMICTFADGHNSKWIL
jgi:hypothetical protein